MVATFLSGGRVPPVEEVGRNGVEEQYGGPNLAGVNPISPPQWGRRLTIRGPGDPGWGPDEAVSPQGVMELAVPGGLRAGMMMEWKAGEG
jgi:hypothetical protein